MNALEPGTNTHPRSSASVRPSEPCPLGRGEPWSLAHVVRAAVRAIDEGTLTPVAGNHAGPACQPRTLLALLSYSYAREIYSSTEIEQSLQRDAQFRVV